jgi:beta-glucosidase
MHRKILLLLLSLSAMFLNGCMGVDKVNPCDVVIGSHTAVTPVPRPEREGWMARHQAIVDRVAKGNIDLLMVGDSITAGWEKSGKTVWDKYYGSRNAVNLGIGGDRTEHVLWRLENGEIENIHPKLAVLLIGTNNSNGEKYTEEQIADGIKAIVCKLRTKLPKTKVLILAIFPRGNTEQRKGTENDATFNAQWAKNDAASQLASQAADGKMVFFLDVNKAFLNEQGVLTRAVMPDLLHPKAKGYQLWAAAMEPTIAKLLGETK